MRASPGHVSQVETTYALWAPPPKAVPAWRGVPPSPHPRPVGGVAHYLIPSQPGLAAFLGPRRPKLAAAPPLYNTTFADDPCTHCVIVSVTTAVYVC